MNCTTFSVRKDALHIARLATSELQGLASGQVRLRIERFALTSNNITYAAFGEGMQYWNFFPCFTPEGEADPAWGTIPVWGFATVVESTHPDLALGERFYGYFPMATSVDLQPTRVNANSFVDGAEHRANLHAVYNQYVRTAKDAFYTPGTEDIQALLRPLFITSWLIDDFLSDNAYFGAAQLPGQRPAMLLSSASSKTAYGTAFQMAQRGDAEIIGLTSAANVRFCESLGCYSRVLTYESMTQLSPDTPCVYIDFSGNAGFRKSLHTHFPALKYSCSIGGTHLSELKGGSRDLPGPRPTLFFAPAQIKKRSQEWGPVELNQRLVQAWQAFCAKVCDASNPWLQVHAGQGAEAVEAVYRTLLSGQVDPRTGHTLSL